MAYKKLECGENTIDTMIPVKRPQGGYEGKFSLRLYSGKRIRITVTAPTIGSLRGKARKRAEERLANEGRENTWTLDSLMTAYIKEVASPAVKNSNLRANSKIRYEYLLKVLAIEFDDLTIRDAIRFRCLESTLKSISQKHGTISAQKARNVLSRWILQQLIRDEVINANPLAGMQIDLGNNKKTTKSKGGEALSEEEWNRVLDYLTNIDSTKVKPPKRGRYTSADRAKCRQAIIDLTLLQATTGLRINEALTLTVNDIKDDGKQIHLHVSEERSKTHRARTVPILDNRGIANMRKRLHHLKSHELVFNSPLSPNKIWDASNVRKLVRTLYNEIAEECDVPLLKTARTHVWRPTLNTIAMNRGVPPEIRAAYFGHAIEINKSAYTDTRDVTPLLNAFT